MQLTPMLSQYLDIKKQHPDAILFYQMGDFFEMFFEDALEAAPLLEVTLTSRDRTAANPIPMCGIPIHALSTYLPRLLAHGKRVAVCQQVENPEHAKGIVKREVTRVFTPALVADPELVAPEVRNILFVAAPSDTGLAVCLVDLLASETRTGEFHSKDLFLDLLQEWQPKELLIPSALSSHEFVVEALRILPTMTVTLRDKFFESDDAVKAAAAYLKETQGLAGGTLSPPLRLVDHEALKLDAVTVSALSVVRTPWKDELSLSDVLDGTLTSMGRRRLKEWLLHPLSARKAIEQRLDAVESFLKDDAFADSIREPLKSLRDLERLASKSHLGLSLPRDLVAIREILKRIPALKTRLKTSKAARLKQLAGELDAMTSLAKLLDEALLDEPNTSIREGGIFKETYHPEIKEYRALSQDAKGFIAAMETREKERTGISSLKVKYSRVFGYTIEITKSYLDRVPKDYRRKQTIANGERFVTDELKKFEEKAMSAEHRLSSLEEALFLELRRKVAEASGKLLQNARLLSELDVLQGFAKVSKERGYRRPELVDSDSFVIEEGRHPVIETLMPQGEFVPNSIEMDDTSRTWIITGPNMAGKSTIMRQVALIGIMAQAGCFVSAAKARLPLFDAIFTRIGSSDDLTRGRSTFMVEMAEVARILGKATPKSLILIDEIGRGTSTYDGLALAWSILEYVHTEVGAKTLFATHFHELTALEKAFTGLVNRNVLVDRRQGDVVFLHRLGPGACSRSYGVDVAKLAGLPPKVLARAGDVLKLLESQSERVARVRSKALDPLEKQLLFFDEPKIPETLAPLES